MQAINILHLLRIQGENRHHLAEGEIEIHLMIITNTTEIVWKTGGQNTRRSRLTTPHAQVTTVKGKHRMNR